MTSSLPKIHQIIRSKRKSFGLELKTDGRLIVRAPRAATRAQIEAVVAQKAGWIEKTRARLASQSAQHPPKTFSPGEKFWYLGQQYPLRLTDRQRPLLDLNGAFCLSRQAHSQAKAVFIAWYREETRQITRSLIQTYTQQYGFKVNQVRVTSARTRWGSCSGKGNLNFTYRLCMAPLNVVEYVVVHELVHLKVPNHSRVFWAEVARVNPTYQTSRAWLKQHGRFLTLD
ncbi:MAG: M48 family metallopeptidase [Brevefilum sp.]